MYNGKPVKGTKGACPINSTWVEDSQSEPSSDNNQLFADSKTFGNWFDPANYDKFKYKRGTVTRSMDDFFHKMGYTPPGWKPLSTRPNEEPVEFASGGSDSGRRGKATLDPQHTSRHGGEFKPTMMQKLGANMKNPEWWSESISGLPSDTRLMRLGQLMNYYGKTPKGRKDSDDPSKVWAANEVASAKIQETKDVAKAKAAKDAAGDSYDWSFTNVNKVAEGFFNDKFGFDWWGGKDKEDTKSKFMSDLTDEKARYPQLNLQELMELMMSKYPNRYK
jgi:hypothetical protein